MIDSFCIWADECTSGSLIAYSLYIQSCYFSPMFLARLSCRTPCFHSSSLVSLRSWRLEYYSNRYTTGRLPEIVGYSPSLPLDCSKMRSAYFFHSSLTCAFFYMSISMHVMQTLCFVCDISVLMGGPVLPPILITLQKTGILLQKSQSANLMGTQNPTILGLLALALALGDVCKLTPCYSGVTPSSDSAIQIDGSWLRVPIESI